MKKKYKLLLHETTTILDHKLYRIQALRDFGNVKKGDLGGYVGCARNLSQTGDAWIGDNAKVFGRALVCDNALVIENAIVQGDAIIKNNAKIADCSMVFGKSVIKDYATLYDFASVGNSIVCEHARLYDNMQIENTVIRRCDDVLYIRGLGDGHSITVFNDNDKVTVIWKDYKGDLEGLDKRIRQSLEIPIDQFQKLTEMIEVYFKRGLSTESRSSEEIS